MQNANLEETQPTHVAGETEEPPPKTTRWWLWSLLGVFGLSLITGLSAYLGYRAGLDIKTAVEQTATIKNAEEQFALGLRDLEAGLYDRARQRFEFVIEQNPNYPGVTDRLAEALLALNVTATTTPVPTPTLTPTQDLRGAEDLFFQAEQLMREKNWTSALETLDTLRQKQPDFRAIDVDGMYYVVLRNRGVDKISLDGNLEGGIYDLTLAEQFGPLDKDAEAWRSWSRMYLSGASFWDIDWIQTISIFSELALIAPNIRDTSGWTATERLRQAYIRYGNLLVGAEDWCNAQIQFENALSISSDPNLEPTATQVTRDCWTPTPKPQPPTNTPQPTEGPPPEETPTPTPGG